MQQRSAFGWLLAGAFCAAVSCGGDNNSAAPQGFGLPCNAAKDCASYDLLCGASKTCVACLGDAVCKDKEVCSAGLCKALDECSDSRDCSGVQVCDEDAGVCVDCVTSRDCDEGQKCDSNSCSDRPACEFTSDCDDGLLCLVDPGVCVSCREDEDCPTKRVCEDYECVVPEPVSTAGKSGTAGSGGKSSTAGSGGNSTAGTGIAGTSTGGNGGRAGAGGMSGNAGTGGTPGAGGEGGAGGSVDCGCLVSQACTPDLRCVAPTLVDDLLDCDNEILPISGRNGTWAAAADTGINIMHGFTDPGSGWVDHSCAAWAAGGELTVNNPNATFAFIGFRLNVDAEDNGLAYDLSPYSGLQLQLESNSTVQVVLKTIGGGYFQYSLGPIASGSYLRSAPFSSMVKMNNSLETFLDLTTVYEIQFSVTTPKSFGLAIHRVTFY